MEQKQVATREIRLQMIDALADLKRKICDICISEKHDCGRANEDITMISSFKEIVNDDEQANAMQSLVMHLNNELSLLCDTSAREKIELMFADWKASTEHLRKDFVY